MTRSRHIVISGTGRAGTSFLVRFLHEAGFDTHISRHPDPQLDQAARAGLEDFPNPASKTALPFVIKSPWIAANPELALPPDRFDVVALIVPMRDLTDAAASRVLVERAAMHPDAVWSRDFMSAMDGWAHVPGGIVHSLSVVDQARLLAVWFHNLVLYATRHDVPLILLDFPRFIHDAAYLCDRLAPTIPLDRDKALAAHARVADPALVRTRRDLDAAAAAESEQAKAIDQAALRRRVDELEALLRSRSEASESLRPAPPATLFEALQMWNRGRNERRRSLRGG